VNVSENEFSDLTEQDLHFLRVFIHSDGKLKDVEKALGISYPSVKSRLQKLKQRLAASERAPKTLTPHQILEMIENGELDYEQGLAQLKLLNKGN
jgi:hypothetical protein